MATYRNYQSSIQTLELRTELAKSAFYRTKHQIVCEIESEQCDRKYLTDLCVKFDKAQEDLIELLVVLSESYEEAGEVECIAQILYAMKEIGSDYDRTLTESRYFIRKKQDASFSDGLSTENVSVIEKSDRVLSRTVTDEADNLKRQLDSEIEMEISDLSNTMEESFKAQKSEITQPTDNRNSNIRSHYSALHVEQIHYRKPFATTCKICNGSHEVLGCEKFRKLSNSDRWDEAKKQRLCFRCLGDDHRGDVCPRTTQCGENGRTKTHHRMLHFTDSRALQNSYIRARNSVNPMVGEQTFTSHSEKYHSGDVYPEFDALRIVPVIVSNGNRHIRINALLDDGSTRSYINSDVAAELGLQANEQQTTVKMLNGKREHLQTMAVDFVVESVDGYIQKNVNALTVDRITGDLKVTDWSRYASNWDHLQGIRFPNYRNKQTVDILLGIDIADLHYSKRDIPGQPGEPVARLTPLGWTCVGPLGSHNRNNIVTHHASTFFLRNEAIPEQKSVASHQKLETRRTDSVFAATEQYREKTVETSTGIVNRESKRRDSSNDLLSCEPITFHRADLKLQRKRETMLPHSNLIKPCDQACCVDHISSDTKYLVWYPPQFVEEQTESISTQPHKLCEIQVQHHTVFNNDTDNKAPRHQTEILHVLQFLQTALVCCVCQMHLQIDLKHGGKRYRCCQSNHWIKEPPDCSHINLHCVCSKLLFPESVCQQCIRSFEVSSTVKEETLNWQ